MRERKAFTLIELLVVIAIIGILAAMILIALNAARQKAKDARVKSDIAQARLMVEKYYDDNGAKYTGLTRGTVGGAPNCTASNSIPAGIETLISDMCKQSGSGGFAMYSNADSYAMSAPLTTSGSTWCLDSTGIAKLKSAQLPSGRVDCNY